MLPWEKQGSQKSENHGQKTENTEHGGKIPHGGSSGIQPGMKIGTED